MKVTGMPANLAKKLIEIFLKIKVWMLRKYYRFVSARGWKGHIEDAPYSTLQIPTNAGSIPAHFTTLQQQKKRWN